MAAVPPRTPVLVGVGLVSQRQEDPLLAEEPLALMVNAARAAGDDCGAPALLRQVQLISVPKGRWRYRDPGRSIAQAVGAGPVTSIVAKVGVLQEKLVGDACERIAAGDIDAALVVGGEAGYRLLRARVGGVEIADAQQETEPDAVWSAPDPIMTPGEMAFLGDAAPPYYAVIDSAVRAHRQVGLAKHRADLARLYAGFSQVAADNPHAWRRQSVDADFIRVASDRNPMIAFPYTKFHTTDWSVDQASALLLCSAGRAAELGVRPDRWVFPRVTALSDHMVNVSERAALHECPGADIAARAVFDHTGLSPADLDLVDLYSCFPVAVLSHAAAVGVDPTRSVTLTGGMRFAGGPFNNYVLHTTAQLAQRLRGTPGRHGLVSSVSGILTKHAFSLWGTSPGGGYRVVDVTSEVDKVADRAKVRDGYSGPGRVAGYTVLYEENRPVRGVAVIDTEGGDRALAATDDSSAVADMTADEFCGRLVMVDAGRFVPGERR